MLKHPIMLLFTMRRFLLTGYALFFILYSLSWSEDSVRVMILNEGWKDNHTEKALGKKGEQVEVISAAEMSEKDSLSSYDVMLINEWWTKKTRDVLNEHASNIQKFVEDGGVVVVFFSLHSTCDIEYWTSSWSPYPLYAILNNKSQNCKDKAYYYTDNIEQEGHPIFRGFDSKFLKIGDKKAFNTYDNRWQVLTQNLDQKQPTFLESKYGKGRYLVVGASLAYRYLKSHHATLLIDNIMIYVKNIARKIKKEKEREKGLKESQKQPQQKQEQIIKNLKTETSTEPQVVSQPSKDDVSKDTPSITQGSQAEEAISERPAKSTVTADAPADTANPQNGILLPLKVGNSWEFTNGQIWNITGLKQLAQKTAYILNFSSGMGAYYIGYESDGVYIYGNAIGGVDKIFQAPQLMFKFPTTISETYQTSQSLGGGAAIISVSSVSEKVESPSGTFENCIEYTVIEEENRQFWYMKPGVGFVKARLNNVEMDLQKYTIN